MWMRILLQSWESTQRLDHAARVGLRQVPHLGGALGRDPGAGHLVLAPEGAIDQRAIGGGEALAHRRIELAQG